MYSLCFCVYSLYQVNVFKCLLQEKGKKRPKENHGKTEIKRSKIKNEVNGFLKKMHGDIRNTKKLAKYQQVWLIDWEINNLLNSVG